MFTFIPPKNAGEIFLHRRLPWCQISYGAKGKIIFLTVYFRLRLSRHDIQNDKGILLVVLFHHLSDTAKRLPCLHRRYRHAVIRRHVKPRHHKRSRCRHSHRTSEHFFRGYTLARPVRPDLLYILYQQILQLPVCLRVVTVGRFAGRPITFFILKRPDSPKHRISCQRSQKERQEDDKRIY